MPSVTIRIPKWLLWALAGAAVLALVGGAFLLGRSSGGDSHPATAGHAPAASKNGRPAKEAVCSKQAAEAATLDTEFEDRIRTSSAIRADLEGTDTTTETPFFSDNPVDYQVGILECADLTGDGIGEMVVGLSAGASGRVFQWAIFTPDGEGRWILAFDRELTSVGSLEIEGNAVVVETPTYDRNDPLCCPTGSRTTKVDSRDGEFRVTSPTTSPEERLITIEDGAVAKLGQLHPLEASKAQAVALFGTPTSITNSPSSLCRTDWGDIGLSISFASFGRADPCSEGRVASFDVVGAAAEQAGWRTDRGARVGSSVAELERLYPDARRSGSQVVLVEAPSPLGANGRIAIVTAYLQNGIAGAYRFYVGAAGE